MRTRAMVPQSRTCHHFRLEVHEHKACFHFRDAGKIAPDSAMQVRNKTKMKGEKEEKFSNLKKQGCHVVTLPQ